MPDSETRNAGVSREKRGTNAECAECAVARTGAVNARAAAQSSSPVRFLRNRGNLGDALEIAVRDLLVTQYRKADHADIESIALWGRCLATGRLRMPNPIQISRDSRTAVVTPPSHEIVPVGQLVGDGSNVRDSRALVARVITHFGSVAAVRDAILIVTTIDYILGYGVSAILVYRLHLAALPVLDAQYFSAGIPILVLVGLLLFLVRRTDRWGKEWQAFVSRRPWRVQQLCFALLGFVASLSIAVAASRSWQGFECHITVHCVQSWDTQAAGLVLWGVSVVSLLFLTYSVSRAPRAHRIVVFCLIRPLMLAVFLGTFVVLVQSVYPRIPDVLGGAKPRCARLDLKRSDFSPATLTELKMSVQGQEDVIQSWPLIMYYAGPASVAVALPLSVTGDLRGPVIEVPRSSVRAILGCEKATAIHQASPL